MKRETKIKIGYLGPENTYSHLAAKMAAKKLGVRDYQLVAYSSIAKVVSAMENNDYAVVPRENSIEGEVNATLDSLINLPEGVQIVGEVIVPVNHVLAVAKKEFAAEKIRQVYSHEQAFAQCHEYLTNLGADVSLCALESTAAAAARVKDLNQSGVGAICAKEAAESLGLYVVAEDIADFKENKTLFIILSRALSFYKTSLVFSVPDKAGALDRVIEVFAMLGINLIKLQHRPFKENGNLPKLGRYVFFAEIEGFIADRKIQFALDDVRYRTEFMKILGSYPV